MGSNDNWLPARGAGRIPKFPIYKRSGFSNGHLLARKINSGITGGSSGIGKHLAIECIKNGAHVSIITRNSSLSEEAKADILRHVSTTSDQKVCCFSVGHTNRLNAPYVLQAEEELGSVFLLANCAGYARAAKFEDTAAIDKIKNMTFVNYFGATQFSHAVISGMKGRREGSIIFVSSQGGLCGIYGFAAYAASKFALRGLAEALAMELKPYNVTVSISFPPDTDTLGFAKESKDKPEETRLISEAAGLYSPETVANALMNDALKGRFTSTVGFKGYLQSNVCIGMAPRTSFFDFLHSGNFHGNNSPNIGLLPMRLRPNCHTMYEQPKSKETAGISNLYDLSVSLMYCTQFPYESPLLLPVN